MKRLTIFMIFLLVSPQVWGQTQDSLITQPNGAYGKDAHIKEGSPMINYGINTIPNIQLSATDTLKLLIQFDSVTVAINSTSIVDSAFLYLIVNYVGSSSGTDTMEIYEIQQLWTEGTENAAAGICSWDSASTSADNGGAADSAWSTPGGTVNSTRSTAIYIDLDNDAVGDTLTFDITTLVQSWVDLSVPNYGVMVMWKEDGDNSYLYQIHSSDSETASLRPKLTVYYTLAAAEEIATSGISYMRGWIVKGHMPDAKGLARSAWNSMMRTRKK